MMLITSSLVSNWPLMAFFELTVGAWGSFQDSWPRQHIVHFNSAVTAGVTS